MKDCIVCIADTAELARALDRYLRFSFQGQIECYFMTYDQCLLSATIFRQADLFILELFRRDDMGFRAEGIPVAEKWTSAGKRVLLVSGAAESANIESQSYWDLAAAEPLHERVRQLLRRPPGSSREFRVLSRIYRTACRPAFDNHTPR